MNELSLDGFRHAIRKMHGSECQLVGRQRVHEILEGETVWQGEVLIFDLLAARVGLLRMGGGRPGDGDAAHRTH